jgi:sortase A
MTDSRTPRPAGPRIPPTPVTAAGAPAPAHKRLRRRLLSWIAVVVAVLGLGMAGYPFAGEHYPPGYKQAIEKLIEWSTFLSDLQSHKIQDRLAQQFATMTDPRLAREGDALTRLEIPKLGVNVLVVQGTSLAALRAGAGHYPSTPLPGARGNVTIAGHRTTYGRPFNGIDRLRPGDLVILTTPVGRYTYKVSKPPWVVDPNDWSVAGPSKGYLLTLTSCHPKGSANHRIIVRAVLTSSQPVRPKP